MKEFVALTERTPRTQDVCAGAAFRQSEMQDGEIFCEAYRQDGGYLLRFAAIADFIISSDGKHITMIPEPAADRGTIAHVYMNHVLPHALSQQHLLVFHASCVALEGGNAPAVAFCGKAGMGKSTLAAAFASRGHAFLSDDGLHVDRVDEYYIAHPSHPSIRLWDDSQTGLGLQGSLFAEPVSFSSKGRLLAGDKITYCDKSMPLRAVFVLLDDGAERTAILPMPPGEAFSHLFSQSFLLDTGDRTRVTAHFDQISAFAATIPCFTLDYPRRYDRLEDAAGDILAFVQSLGRAP